MNEGVKIGELVKEAHKNAVEKGFWEDMELLTCEEAENNAIATRLALITSETSEALEALRNGQNEQFAEELADIVIRVADLAGGMGVDLSKEIIKKMEKNKDRGYKHNKKF